MQCSIQVQYTKSLYGNLKIHHATSLSPNKQTTPKTFKATSIRSVVTNLSLKNHLLRPG